MRTQPTAPHDYRGQLSGVKFPLLPLYGLWDSNPGPQACPTNSLCNEPSHWPCSLTLMSSYFVLWSREHLYLLSNNASLRGGSIPLWSRLVLYSPSFILPILSVSVVSMCHHTWQKKSVFDVVKKHFCWRTCPSPVSNLFPPPPNLPSLSSSLPFPSFPSNFLSYVSHFSQGLECLRLAHTMEGSLLRKGILLQSLFKCSTIVRIQRYHGILCKKRVNLL